MCALQTAVVYAFGAYDKAYWGFLSGARLQHYVLESYATAIRPTWWWFETLYTGVALSTVAFEAALAVGLFFARGRRYLVIPGLHQHGVFYAAFDVAIFSATMLVLYLSFFEPNAVHDVIDRLQGVTHGPTSAKRPALRDQRGLK